VTLERYRRLRAVLDPDVAAHCRARGIDYPPLDAEGIPRWQAWSHKP
jgi:hypothetical protein